jgi:hypothetical protein
LLNVGEAKVNEKEKEEFKKMFDCADVGKLIEFVGVKIVIDQANRTAKLTQQVLLQSFGDEFEIRSSHVDIPATAGRVISYKREGGVFGPRKAACVSIRCWEIDASVEVVLTRHQECGTRTNTRYDTGNGGEFLIHAASDAILFGYTQLWSVVETFGVWKNNEELIVTGMSDATYASDLDTWQRVMGWTTFLNGAPVIMKSNMQLYSDLLVTESELGSATEVAQDMLFVMQILELMGLRVKKPMLLYIDNKGTKDLANNWSVGGRTRHVEVWMYFLRELKAHDLIHCVQKF